MQKENNLSKNKVTEISKQIESIFEHQYFKKFSNTFVEDIIWIGSQARIFQDNAEICMCVDTFLKEVNKILYNESKFEIHLNTISYFPPSKLFFYFFEFNFSTSIFNFSS